MANPRYQTDERRSPRDSKLATALQFANLGLEQQQISDRQHQGRVMQAIQLLGLQQQQAQDAARQQQAADMLGLQREEAGANAQFRQDTLGETRANRQGDERHRGVLEQQGSDALAMQLVREMMGNPSIPLDTALGFAPASQQANIDRMRSTALQGRIGQATAAVSPVYQANQNNPAKIAEALKVIEGQYMTQPEVWNGIPWEQLNSSLSSTSASGPSVPRRGGLFGSPTQESLLASGAVTDPRMSPEASAAIIARNNELVKAQNKAELDSVWNFIFGTPTR